MPFLHNLLSVLVQIAKKMGLQKNRLIWTMFLPVALKKLLRYISFLLISLDVERLIPLGHPLFSLLYQPWMREDGKCGGTGEIIGRKN
jgi:hypothetical protein